MTSTSSGGDPTPQRCLLLGPSGSGKTTFLYRVKTGEYLDVQPTDGFLVEEILINKKGDTITFSEVGGSNRRNIRLQFLQSLPFSISILFFIDVTSTPEALQQAFEELIYVISYTNARGCAIHYLGVVLNKQDLLNSVPHSLTTKTRGKSSSWSSRKSSQQQQQQKQPRVDLDLEKFPEVIMGEKEEKELIDNQSEIVRWIKKEVYEEMEKYKLAQPEEFGFHSELLHTGPDGKGISMKTGDGVQEVYRRLIQGMEAGRKKINLSRLEKIESGEQMVG